MDRILSDATAPGQSVPGGNAKEEVIHIPQNFTNWNIGIRCFYVIIQDTGWWGSYSYAEMHSVYILQP